MDALRTDVNASIEGLRTELAAKIEDLHRHLSAKIEDVREELGVRTAGLDAHLRGVGHRWWATRVGVGDLQVRVRGLEPHARQPAEAAHPPSTDAGRVERP